MQMRKPASGIKQGKQHARLRTFAVRAFAREPHDGGRAQRYYTDARKVQGAILVGKYALPRQVRIEEHVVWLLWLLMLCAKGACVPCQALQQWLQPAARHAKAVLEMHLL